MLCCQVKICILKTNKKNYRRKKEDNKRQKHKHAWRSYKYVISKFVVYYWRNSYGHYTICAKIYWKNRHFYLCKVWLYGKLSIVKMKNLSKNNLSLANSKDCEKKFIILKVHLFVFDLGMQKVKEVCRYY